MNRSYLYVPGDRPEMLAKALDRGADAVIVDLEDAVAPDRKAAARHTVAEWLRGLDSARSHPPSECGGSAEALPGRAGMRVEIWVRVNPGPAGPDDVRAVLAPAVSGIVAAKVESAADLGHLDRALHEAERATGRVAGSVAVAPLIESAAAVLRLDEIAGAPRVRRLQAGEADLCADAGVTPGEDEHELLFVRSRLVLVSAAYRLEPPVGPVAADFADLVRLRRTTWALARLGFVGRACIHPAQVPVVHEVFTPAPAEVDRARALIAAFDRARAAGNGVLVDDQGRMVDEAVVRRARRVIRLAQR
jgi:citrate lyase subunit beta/citryl-CoA lyase